MEQPKRGRGRIAGSKNTVTRKIREEIQKYLAEAFPKITRKMDRLLDDDPYLHKEYLKVLMDKGISNPVEEDSKGKSRYDHEMEKLERKHEHDLEKLDKMKELGIESDGGKNITITIVDPNKEEE